jgi:hypothetical protein
MAAQMWRQIARPDTAVRQHLIDGLAGMFGGFLFARVREFY